MIVVEPFQDLSCHQHGVLRAMVIGRLTFRSRGNVEEIIFMLHSNTVIPLPTSAKTEEENTDSYCPVQNLLHSKNHMWELWEMKTLCQPQLHPTSPLLHTSPWLLEFPRHVLLISHCFLYIIT